MDRAFEDLLTFVRDNRGFDFTGYKRPSLVRRVEKRMAEIGIAGFEQYRDHLEAHPDEFTHLFNTILINVTGFFRDPGAWEFLDEEVVRRIVERADPLASLRVWSAGCASGEEAYTVAMLLAERIGLDRLAHTTKIYATDVDEDALAQARSGAYDAKAVAAIPEPLRDKYLVEANGGLVFRKELRRALIFGRHDLVSDPPISRVDLIVCRNTLMYFNAEIQTKIYRNFHFALKPDGFLFMGKSEMLLTRTDTFVPFNLRHRVFARVPRATDENQASGRRPDNSVEDRLREAVFESASIAQVIVSAAGTLAAANGRARALFGLGPADFGRPFHELELSYRPVELRSRMDQALVERVPTTEPGVAWTGPGGVQLRLDVEVSPVLAEGEAIGTTITFADVSRAYQLQQELERSRLDLESAYEELQSTVEELETTNEELQSTNEELETTNEELQSTNEELETMNEELQSTNEELETINTELRDRTSELNRTNAFLESVLASVQAGVVVLDGNLNVEGWNSRAEDLWGLRRDEVVGKSLFGLDFGLPVDQLQALVRQVKDGDQGYAELVIDAVNRRGKPFACKVTISPMREHDGDSHGTILLMEAAAT